MHGLPYDHAQVAFLVSQGWDQQRAIDYSAGIAAGIEQGRDQAYFNALTPEIRLPRMFPKLASTPWKPRGGGMYRFNCIAWAAGDVRRHWWPGQAPMSYWPDGTPDLSLANFIQAYRTVGYSPCHMDPTNDPRLKKIVIYTKQNITTGQDEVQHASLQRITGVWSSKLGPWELIDHEFDAVSGHTAKEYGDIVQMMQLRRNRLDILRERMYESLSEKLGYV